MHRWFFGTPLRGADTRGMLEIQSGCAGNLPPGGAAWPFASARIRGPIESTRPSDRSLLPEYGLCGLDEDAQLRRQRCTPRVIQKQSIKLDGALRQQPFESALADVAARQRFDCIGDADAGQRKPDRVRRVCDHRRPRCLDRRALFAVGQFPIENPAGADETSPMQLCRCTSAMVFGTPQSPLGLRPRLA